MSVFKCLKNEQQSELTLTPMKKYGRFFWWAELWSQVFQLLFTTLWTRKSCLILKPRLYRAHMAAEGGIGREAITSQWLAALGRRAAG